MQGKGVKHTVFLTKAKKSDLMTTVLGIQSTTFNKNHYFGLIYQLNHPLLSGRHGRR